MDSMNSFKGYGKVDEAEERAFRRKTRRRITIITISTVILLIVVIAAVAGVLMKKKNTESSPIPTSKPLSLSQSIKAVCSVTQYPDSCFSSISSMHNGSSDTADPKELFLLSLKATVKELSGLTSLPDNIISKKINGVDQWRSQTFDMGGAKLIWRFWRPEAADFFFSVLHHKQRFSFEFSLFLL
ncbi:hypothetical protein MKW94_026215 [Papaver nudicaule]|uniref:Pectinesterase inhibitor domain-containing protein n=1 Tax=Papaver nudicaule TaxID=74823 RepID=A0AA41S218_PAPNU|nr:hypothetical protein [Papaver nudicaule]